MKKVVFLWFIFVSGAGIFTAQAQNVTGKWKTIDDETGEAKSIVEIYEKNGKIYGKVIEIFNPAKRDAKCQNCKGSDKDQPVLGLEVIKGLYKDGDQWSGGQVLDPNKGKLYKCIINLEGENKLNIRGYIGISLLGRSQTWIRI